MSELQLLMGTFSFSNTAIKNLISTLDIQDCHIANRYNKRDCDNDHGERTNYKLKDQPFYARGRNGKMRNY